MLRQLVFIIMVKMFTTSTTTSQTPAAADFFSACLCTSSSKFMSHILVTVWIMLSALHCFCALSQDGVIQIAV